ncbi:MAG: hypothetical protein ACXVC2_12285, partial [Bacteroidia bacterium]
RDSAHNLIYCFNQVKAQCCGKMNCDKENNIKEVTVYYPNGKIFHRFSGCKRTIYSPEGVKLFERVNKYILAFSDGEKVSWIYDFSLKKATDSSKPWTDVSGVIYKDLDIQKEYYDVIFNLWRKNFAK